MRTRYRSASGKAALLISAVLSMNCCLPVLAGTSDSLTDLETKLFQHGYPQDTTDARLTRLEKMVFGQKRGGSNDSRVAALTAAMPKMNAGTAAPQQAAAAPPQPLLPEHPSTDDRVTQAPPSPPPFSSGTTSGAAPLHGGIEQTISDLEVQVHGETFKQRPLTERLTNLENSLGGAENADHSGSIAQRLTRLQTAVGMDASAGAAHPVEYKKAYTSQEAAQQAPHVPKPNNGHPYLKKAAEAAVVAGAVAGVAALTIMATKGMGGGGCGMGMAKHLMGHHDLF